MHSFAIRASARRDVARSDNADMRRASIKKERRGLVTTPRRILFERCCAGKIERRAKSDSRSQVLAQRRNLPPLAVVALFAVLGEVESDGFHLFAGPQAYDGLDDVGDYDGAHHGQRDGQADRLELLQPQGLA